MQNRPGEEWDIGKGRGKFQVSEGNSNSGHVVVLMFCGRTCRVRVETRVRSGLNARMRQGLGSME